MISFYPSTLGKREQNYISVCPHVYKVKAFFFFNLQADLTSGVGTSIEDRIKRDFYLSILFECL